MSAQSVCAVIVTYHPNAKMLEHMSDILAQVQGMVVADNGSNPDELHALQTTGRTLGFHLIENRENLGIAEALNQGVLWAKSAGYGWVVLFDQDSTITEGFVCQLLAAWESHPNRERVGSIQPRYVIPETGVESLVPRASDGGPATAMTSGTLMPMWIFDRIGLFASEYFIDLVDCEYSLRIRAAGYLLADSREAVLLHCAGRPKRLTFLGFSFGPTHHSAMRRYYMSRNRIAVYRKYFSVFPAWVFQSMYYDFLRETFKCFVGETDRLRKLRSFLLGTWDGLTGRMGRREGL
jgi:rhamnosyltransferase